MLQQAKMGADTQRFEQPVPEIQNKQNLSRIRSDVNRLVVARYVILFMGAALLLSVGIQALFLDGGVAYSRVFKIALVAIIGPGLIWAASDKEVRLLLELDRNNSKLDQKVRENKALNRMTQDHLASCFSEPMQEHSQAQAQAQAKSGPRPQLKPAVSEMVSEPAAQHYRSDIEHVMVLDPSDNNYGRRYLQAVA